MDSNALLQTINKIKSLSSDHRITDYKDLINNMNEIHSLCKSIIPDEIDEVELVEIDFDDFEPDSKFSITDNLSDYLHESIRDIFDFDTWDEPDTYEKLFKYNDVIYKIEIKENGCCEATHEHRIMYWKNNVSVYEK